MALGVTPKGNDHTALNYIFHPKFSPLRSKLFKNLYQKTFGSFPAAPKQGRGFISITVLRLNKFQIKYTLIQSAFKLFVHFPQ